MSQLKFGNHIYTLSQLIELRLLSPKYKEGEVFDTQTGETLDIQEIDNLKEFYIDELIPNNEKEKCIDKVEKKRLIELYEKKYADNRITKDELYQLIKLKNKDYLQVKYDDFIFVNIAKGKPKSLSIIDYGRFMLLLDLMSFSNKIQHSNGRKIKEQDILNKLELRSPKSLINLISKLSKFGMLSKSGYGEKRFIHINPVYAKRNIRIDQTIYDLFSDDLKEYLNEYEIKYFEMNTGIETMDATIEIIK